LKRFESSIEAIRKSIDRLLKFYLTFSSVLEHGNILNNRKFNEIFAEFEEQDDEKDDDMFIEEMKKIELEPAKNLDVLDNYLKCENVFRFIMLI
jgi:hypothetical protein